MLSPFRQQDEVEKLEQRLGRVHTRQRLAIEREVEDQFRGINFRHPENWYSLHAALRAALKLSGVYWRGRRNAERIEVRRHEVRLPDLPASFDGFTILHLSDLHVDMNPGAMRRLIELAGEVQYDICVLTGDYRGGVCGPLDAALEGLAELRAHLKELVFGVLGNHDSLGMAPAMEEMGIRMLLNEAETLERGDERIHLAGIDDAHLYGAGDIEKAAAGIPAGECAILLSHTPEVYRQAAYAGFKLMLAGHTHGGQICLPGGAPVTLFADLPRRMGSGPWEYRGMAGYTSAGAGSCGVAVRFNCPPEITLHHLRCE